MLIFAIFLKVVHSLLENGNQASEFTRLMGMVKLDEPEEAVIPVCQRLVLILREFPNQKSRLMSRHGLIPLMDMLETSNNRVRSMGYYPIL